MRIVISLLTAIQSLMIRLPPKSMEVLSSMCNQDDTVMRENLIVQDDPSITEYENIQKIPDDIPAEGDENMGEDQCNENMPETFVVCSNEDHAKLQNIDQNIQYTPLKVAFDSVLKFKCPKDIPASSRKPNKKAPEAINSQLWRDFQNKKGSNVEKQQERKKN
ncbi:hypothetical protein JTB14_013515 [Gonioctena quinquepunctata]|nr:hypothetical protein JTB14_013515 [Gonioctena quinquepunctata]